MDLVPVVTADAAVAVSGDRADRFAHLMLADGVAAMVANLDTELAVRPVGGCYLPVTINRRGRSPTCYVCCPSAAYVGYARDELRHFTRNRLLFGALNGLVSLGQPLLLASGLDGQVQPNNWLLATNPPPAMSARDLGAITRALIAEWPGLAIAWRSLNDVSDRVQLTTFASAGYTLMPARQVYLFDCRDGRPPPKVHRDERRDRRLLDDGALVLVHHDDFADDDFERAQQLYRLLYLDKYTWLNPHYTAKFLRRMHGGGLLDFHGLRGGSGRLDGVIAIFDSGDVMTAPIVGYDTARPQALGLYRRLMAIATSRARERRILYNMSAGAAGFKRNRGAVAAIEYTTVYAKHLGLGQRAAIGVLQAILSGFGVPLLRRFRL